MFQPTLMLKTSLNLEPFRVFLGYTSGTKGYHLFDPATNSFIISRHVIVYEDKFPFLHSASTKFTSDVSNSNILNQVVLPNSPNPVTNDCTYSPNPIPSSNSFTPPSPPLPYSSPSLPKTSPTQPLRRSSRIRR